MINKGSKDQEFTPSLKEYSIEIVNKLDSINKSRFAVLQTLADYILESIKTESKVQLNFICTHNSRRSHFAQMWMQTAALYYGFDNIDTFSGGTEATAANIRTMNALERAGFNLSVEEKKDGNHIYSVSQGEGFPVNKLFSKVYDDKETNPREKYAAVMVCSDADQNCPIVIGADQRISLTYDDPKADDNTPKESESYDFTCSLIATELFYVMNIVSGKLS